MRIAMLGPTYPNSGGISHYTTLMVRALRRRHTVDFFALRYKPGELRGVPQGTPGPEALVEECTELFHALNPPSWMRFLRQLRRGDYDLVIVQWWTIEFALHGWLINRFGQARRKRPVLWILHNVAMHEPRTGEKLLTRLGLRGGGGFLCHSSEDTARLRALLPGASAWFHVLPSYDHFARAYQQQMGEALPAPQPQPTVLFFGAVRPYKGLQHLLAAWPRVLHELPEARLLIVGMFPFGEERYRAQIAELGIGESIELRAEFIPDAQIGDWFTRADVIVLPYETASQSAVIQVAYGFDLPVITTRVGGLPESVEEGVSGHIVEPKDAEALAAAIVGYFRAGGRPRLVPALRAYRRRFEWGAMVDHLEAIATELHN